MKKVVTCSQMKLLDHGTIHNMHVPSLVLMERAALATAEEIRKYLDKILADFSVALNSQDLRTIEKAYTRTSELLDIVENTPKRSVPVKIEAYLYDEWRRQQ